MYICYSLDPRNIYLFCIYRYYFMFRFSMLEIKFWLYRGCNLVEQDYKIISLEIYSRIWLMKLFSNLMEQVQ